MHNEFDWLVAGTIGHTRLPMDLMTDEERMDYLDARFEGARDVAEAHESFDNWFSDDPRYPGVPKIILNPPSPDRGFVSECCDAPYAGVESPWCPKCHDNTGYYRAYCPECGETLEHFGGLDAMPESIYCPICNNVLYDMTTGVVVGRLV